MSNPTPCELISWNGACGLCRQLVGKIRKVRYHPDIIVAIGRGGYMPARVLSDYLDLMNLTSFKIEHYRGLHKEPVAQIRYPLAADLTGQQVLLVDDVSDSGDTFELALEHLWDRGAAEVRTAALQHKVVSSFVPDYYARKVIKWRWIIYPWAIMENLSVLIGAMEPRPPSIEGIAQRLQQDHGIRVPHKMLKDALAMIQMDSEAHRTPGIEHP
jgi:hypoxanthine phosphoribosyltransferase